MEITAMKSPLVEGLFMIHKIITKGITTSLKKCDEYIGKQGIPPEDAAGFKLYLSTLIGVTHSHHLSEDEIAFPFFKDLITGPYERLKDDHLLISGVLDKLDKCLPEISAGEPVNLRNALIELENLWVPHIKIEEDNFTADKVHAVVGLKEQENITEKLSGHGRKNSGPGPTVLPFLIYNLEGSDRDAFASRLPWIVRKVLVQVIWKRKWAAMKPFLAN